MVAEILQIAELPPELDFLSLEALFKAGTNARDRISRWMKQGHIIGVVPGLYVSRPELRRRPISMEILANRIYGPSYVSFEYVLSAASVIPEAVPTITSATVKRSRFVHTQIGSFLYHHMPLTAYTFGVVRHELADGCGYLVARPEKALVDTLYRSGAVRSLLALQRTLYDDLRIDPERLRELDQSLLAEYAQRMPGDTFRQYFTSLLRSLHG
jgi:hypothetical protein